jgi:SAM-dependent methyltransferase
LEGEKFLREQIASFFNSRADVYGKNEFVNHLFSEREKAALLDDDLAGANVLDVGCGTGRLYGLLCQQLPEQNFNYLGLDPAEKMLLASTIPEHSRRLGSVEQLRIEDGDFDRIYLLGLTTYLPDEILWPMLEKLRGRLKPGGVLIVHFTNSDSVEVRIRQRIRPYIRRIIRGNWVVSGGFKIYPRSLRELSDFLVDVKIKEVRSLPATIPFLQHLSPRLAVNISKRISTYAPGLLRMDFIAVMEANS